MNEAYRAQAAAAGAVDAAAIEYENCLQNGASDCDREGRILDVRRGTLERRSAESASQAAQWQAVGKAMQEQTDRQQEQQLEREKLEVEREKVRAQERAIRQPVFVVPMPSATQIKSIDYKCMSDCNKRYTYSYCQSACSY